jgi:tetratricopeptide (TPR) repeat protein
MGATEQQELSLIGSRVREAAKASGMSLQELGQAIGVARPTIYAYASGALRISDARLKRIAEATGKDESFFTRPPDETIELQEKIRSQFELVDAFLSPADTGMAVKKAGSVLSIAEKSAQENLRAEALLQTGNSYARHGDYISAIRHLQGALQVYEELDESEQVASASQTLGVCLLNLGRIQEAEESFIRAIENYSTSEGWKAEVALAALAERIGSFTEARDRLKALMSDDLAVDQRVYVAANYASLYAAQGRWREAGKLAKETLPLAYETKRIDQVAEFLIFDGLASTFSGNFQDASLSLLRACEMTAASNDDARCSYAKSAVVQLLLANGNLSEARRLGIASLAEATRGGFKRSEVRLLVLLAQIAFARQDRDQGRDYALQAEGFASVHQYVSIEPEAKALIAAAEILDHEFESGYRGFEHALDSASRLGLVAQRVAIEARFGLCLLAVGREERAVDLLKRAFEQARELGFRPLAAELGFLASQGEFNRHLTKEESQTWQEAYEEFIEETTKPIFVHTFTETKVLDSACQAVFDDTFFTEKL